ncbi:hypothetical protein HY612_00505 [Candidatus Roizmanbacteria bacterium]|nr:hypothetical protein [Candidatus Roizmanbacteria bacterium]
MVKSVYEKGTIKVVWIEADLSGIFSKMFTNLEEAKKFGKSKKDYIIFALIKQKNMQDFEWKILPHGKHKLYRLALRLYQRYPNRVIKLFK